MGLVLYKKTLIIILILLATSVSAQLCEENWECGPWSECNKYSKQTRNCNDLNSCGTYEDLPSIERSCGILGYDLTSLKVAYNPNLDKVPWIVKQIIGDEKINLYLSTNAGERIVIGAITDNAEIIYLRGGEIENPTLNVYVTENTINKLKNQEITIQEAIESGEIKYESLSVITSVKLWIADTASTVVSWFT